MYKLLSSVAGCFLVLFTICLEGCHRPSRRTLSGTGLIEVTLQADWYPQPEHGGFYAAIAKGYYKEEGLDVSIQPGGPFAFAAKQVAAGAAEFGMGSSDGILEAIADGG